VSYDVCPRTANLQDARRLLDRQQQTTVFCLVERNERVHHPVLVTPLSFRLQPIQIKGDRAQAHRTIRGGTPRFMTVHDGPSAMTQFTSGRAVAFLGHGQILPGHRAEPSSDALSGGLQRSIDQLTLNEAAAACAVGSGQRRHNQFVVDDLTRRTSPCLLRGGLTYVGLPHVAAAEDALLTPFPAAGRRVKPSALELMVEPAGEDRGAPGGTRFAQTPSRTPARLVCMSAARPASGAAPNPGVERVALRWDYICAR